VALSRPTVSDQKVVAGSKLRKSEVVVATKSSHVGRQTQSPKIMFTGVVADNSEKVRLYHYCLPRRSGRHVVVHF